ncbi:hypothetical protein BGX23_001747 [Mortierella sp. AD031]|nr:hypothetical protein BGX23_001747 [Mortierella sp. AD031]
MSPVANTIDPQEAFLDESQREWVQLIEPVEQDRLNWLVNKLVKAFVEDQLKGSGTVAEIILLGPVLDRDSYRALLSCIVSKFEQTTPLDVPLLEGLVQLVECASAGYLVDNDLVRIATVLSRELAIIHIGTSDHPWFLAWALSRILDVKVAGKVKDLHRDRDHQPMLQLLDSLKRSDNVYLKYQAAYAYQALQCAPDDETPLQALWRYTQLAAAAASSVTSVFKLDPLGFLDGMEHLQQIGGGVADVIKAGIEGIKAGIEGARAVRQGAEGFVKPSENRPSFKKRHPWYLALQGTALYIRQGRLADFNHVVSQAPCHRDVNFQWGVCRQLGEIAVDPRWDVHVREQVVDFLGELYLSNSDWKPHVNVKRWILDILVQISQLTEPLTKDRAIVLLKNLTEVSSILSLRSYPLSTRLRLPSTFPVLERVQKIQKIEYGLHTMRRQRLDEYEQPVYIPPLAKSSLQDEDNTILSDGQGAGKSTFNRYLENQLWKRYKASGRIPLFINLPAHKQPEAELIAEQLKAYKFSEAQIQELEQHRQFILICDGYDESQLTSNLHTTNSLNQHGQRDIKQLITCRTQYLGPDYRDRFVPEIVGQYNRAANNLFQEAAIAPFSNEQIELYVERHVPLEPRTWVKQDYMDNLTTIPNLMDLVKTPFLLTLTLEALPSVVHGKNDFSNLGVSRVQLYDISVEHWLGVNKRRLQNQKLNYNNREALEILLSEGFEMNGIIFQEQLAAAIFQEQEGRPVVDYSHRWDKTLWKGAFFAPVPDITLLRGVSLLSRSGNHHPLSQRNLISEPSIIQFLAERALLEPDFKKQLLALVELSKTDE